MNYFLTSIPCPFMGKLRKTREFPISLRKREAILSSLSSLLPNSLLIFSFPTGLCYLHFIYFFILFLLLSLSLLFLFPFFALFSLSLFYFYFYLIIFWESLLSSFLLVFTFIRYYTSPFSLLLFKPFFNFFFQFLLLYVLLALS